MENQTSQFGSLPKQAKEGHNASPPIAYGGQAVPDMVRVTFAPSSTTSSQSAKTASGGAQPGK